VVGLNRQQLQRQADREKRIHRLERRLDEVNRRRKWETRLSILFLVVAFVALGIFAERVTPVRVDGGTSTEPTQISFQESHADWLQANYNQSVENGFCLFGQVQEEKVVVEQVEFVDNPVRQSYMGMSFTCIPQILARWQPLVSQEEYKLVGAIHTHPETAELSHRDLETFRFFDPVLSVFGVYNGDRLTMYLSPDQGQAMTNVLRTA